MPRLVRTSIHKPRGASWLRFGHETPERVTERLRTEVARKLVRARYATPQARKQLANRLLFDTLGMRSLPADVRAAYAVCAVALVEQAFAPLYQELTAAQQNTDAIAVVEERRRYTRQLLALEHEETFVAQTMAVLRKLLATPRDALAVPNNQGSGLTLPIPLVSLMREPGAVIHSTVQNLVSLAPNPNAAELGVAETLGRRGLRNVLKVSKTDWPTIQKNPLRTLWPAESKLSIDEQIDSYLNGTPLHQLLKSTTNLPVPKHILFEMLMIQATTGWGKSQLLQLLVMLQIDDPERPGIVVIDSQGDVIATLSRLRQFDPNIDDRLVIIDPSDADHPLAFNLFHVDRKTLDQLSPKDREAFLAGIIELFNYIAGALLGAELTAKMQVVFRFLSQWLIQIPDATIHTLLQLLTDPSPYLHYVQELPVTAQAFINDHLLVERSQYKETCQQIARRLFHVLSNPTFERIFSHPTNKFHMGDALNSGRVVLVNTAKGHLKSEWSAIFGRFIIAQIMQATFARSFIRLDQRRSAYIHIDEASEYMDKTTDQILIQGRKFGVSLALYFQTFQQATDAGLKSTMLSIPAVRFTGGINDADANLLAREMNTTSEFLKAVQKHEGSTEWSVYVRGLTPTAIRYPVPFLKAERAPKMSDAAYQKLMARIHAEVAHTPNQAAKPTIIPPPTDNDGDSY